MVKKQCGGGEGRVTAGHFSRHLCSQRTAENSSWRSGKYEDELLIRRALKLFLEKGKDKIKLVRCKYRYMSWKTQALPRRYKVPEKEKGKGQKCRVALSDWPMS